MSDGYVSDESNNVVVFTSGSEYTSSDTDSSDESENEDYVTKTYITNTEVIETDNSIERPTFKYIDHENYQDSELLKPDVQYMINYSTRCSKFDLIGIIAKRAQMLSRGAYPLVKVEGSKYIKETEIDITLKEIEDGLCPYIVRHGKLLLKLKDFEKLGYEYHINNLKTIFDTHNTQN